MQTYQTIEWDNKIVLKPNINKKKMNETKRERTEVACFLVSCY